MQVAARQPLFDYAVRVGLAVLNETVRNATIPEVRATVEVPLIGGIDVAITEGACGRGGRRRRARLRPRARLRLCLLAAPSMALRCAAWPMPPAPLPPPVNVTQLAVDPSLTRVAIEAGYYHAAVANMTANVGGGGGVSRGAAPPKQALASAARLHPPDAACRGHQPTPRAPRPAPRAPPPPRRRSRLGGPGPRARWAAAAWASSSWRAARWTASSWWVGAGVRRGGVGCSGSRWQHTLHAAAPCCGPRKHGTYG